VVVPVTVPVVSVVGFLNCLWQRPSYQRRRRRQRRDNLQEQFPSPVEIYYGLPPPRALLGPRYRPNAQDGHLARRLCVTRGSLPLPELRRKDSNVVIGLELLFNCKYNLLWLQKSLTSGNLNWGIPALLMPSLPGVSFRFQGFPSFAFRANSVSECL